MLARVLARAVRGGGGGSATRAVEALQRDGIAAVQLQANGGDDSWDEALCGQLERMGARVRPHHGKVGAPDQLVWDVEPSGVSGARSKSCESFALHTDASYELPPPAGIGMLFVRQDQKGGGKTSVARVADATRLLSPNAKRVLCETRFRTLIPDEFKQHDGAGGPATVDVPVLLDEAGERIRYRRELFVGNSLAKEQRKALDELDEALAAPGVAHTHLLPEGTLLLLCNHRWMHARSHVLDSRRLVKRVRFDM